MSSILPGFVKAGAYAQIFGKGKAIRLLGATSGTIDIASPAAPTPYTLTLPAALEATDKVLQVSSAGVLTLVDLPAATTPAGSGTEIQYRNAGAFGAVAGSSWNGSTLKIVGRLELGNDHNAVMLGNGTSVFTPGGAPAWQAIAIGSSAAALAYGTAVGGEASTGNFNSMCLGFSSKATASAQLVIGGTTWAGAPSDARGRIRDVYIGCGVTSADAWNWTVTFHGSGASGTNIAGAGIVIAPGPSTGNATPSSVIIQSTVAGSSGSTAQTLTDTLAITGKSITQLYDSSNWIKWDIGATGQVVVTSNAAGSIYFQTTCYTNASFRTASYGSQLTDHRLVLYENAILVGYVSGNITFSTGKFGFGTTAPDKQVEINSTTGDCLRLTYNDANGSAANYADLLVSSAGNLTITPSGGVVSVTGDVRPATDDTYYLGKNDDDSPAAWKGVVLKDTTNGKYYRLEIISGVVTATDLTD